MSTNPTNTPGSSLLAGLQEALQIAQGNRKPARTHTFDVKDRGERIVVQHLVDGVKAGPVRIRRKDVGIE